MATETSTSNQREKQEQSIKARKKELFVTDEPVATGPRKTLREYLRETPAAPLSKNTKLMLWGSAAPVLLLFLSAVATGKGRDIKTPTSMVVPPSPVKPLAVKHNDEPPPAAQDAVAKDGKPKAEEPTKDQPPKEEKPKAKSKKPKKPKKPASGDKPSSTGDPGAKTDTAAKDEKDPKAGASEKMTNQANATPNDAGKDKNKPESRAKAADSNDSPTAEKPKKSLLFKKRRPPVFTYPKREGEKKDEKADPEKAKANP